jgi:hypothetical protein
VNRSPALEQTDILALRTDVVATVLEDGAVLLDLQTKYFYALNGSAWSILQRFEAGAVLADVEAFARSCGAPDDDSVKTFVATVREYDLLEATDSPGDAEAIPPPASWSAPTIERQAEPLQRVLVSAFDPSIPLSE